MQSDRNTVEFQRNQLPPSLYVNEEVVIDFPKVSQKLSLYLTKQTLSREDVWGSLMYRPMFS